MLTGDLFLARASCFPQASLLSSVGSLTPWQGYGVRHLAGCQHWMPTVQTYRVLALTSRCIHFCLSNASDGLINQFFSVCLSGSLCVCEQIGSRTITSTTLPIFTKFCMRLRNAVSSSPIVCETNRKQFADFRGVRIPISAVFRLW